MRLGREIVAVSWRIFYGIKKNIQITLDRHGKSSGQYKSVARNKAWLNISIF